VCKDEAVARSKARSRGGLDSKVGGQSVLDGGAKGIMRSGGRRSSSNSNASGSTRRDSRNGSSGGGNDIADNNNNNGRIGSTESFNSALHGAYPAGGPPGGHAAPLGQSLLDQKRGSIGKRVSIEGHQGPSLEKEPMEKVCIHVREVLSDGSF